LFKKKEIDFLEINKEYNLICAGSKNSKKVFFLSIAGYGKLKPFRVVGYSKLPYKYNYVCWNSSNK